MAGLEGDHHWKVYLPALALSIAGMVPMMIMAERHGRLRGMFLVAISLLAVSTLVLASSEVALAVYLAMWLFFVGFNYLEATLPSLVSKVVFPGGKGTALGIYATCQFLGAFAGGAVGGWLLKYSGPASLVMACLLLAGFWLLLFLPSNSVAVAPVTAAGE